MGDIPPPTEILYSHVDAHIIVALSPANTREFEVVKKSRAGGMGDGGSHYVIFVKVSTQRLSACQYFVLPPFAARQAFSLRRIDLYNARMADCGNFSRSSKTAASKFLAFRSVLACNCFATIPQSLFIHDRSGPVGGQSITVKSDWLCSHAWVV